ncbi:MAG: hypothetical protein E5W44_06605, partial [Mesorhizobium sp.]
MPEYLRAGHDPITRLGAHGDDDVGVNMRPPSALLRFLRIVGRIMQCEHVSVTAELLTKKIAHRGLECRYICAGACRDDEMHDVPALAAVQLPPPFLLDQVAGFFEVSDDAGRLIAHDTLLHALDQISYPRRREFHAIAVTAKPETDFRFSSDIGIVYPLLDDRRCLGVSGQALAAWVAQHHDAPHLELA